MEKILQDPIPREIPHATRPATAAAPRWLVATLSGLCLAVVYLFYGEFQGRAELGDRLAEVQKSRTALETKASSLEQRLADATAKLEATNEKLALTSRELERAEALARQNRQERQRLAGRFSARLDAQEHGLVSLEGAVEGVTARVASNRQHLDGAMGDLREQTVFVARNRVELEELRKRGERDYLEFDLWKSARYVRVGPVALRLDKADPGRQRYTLTLVADDTRVEKKDKTLLEPVQFYARGTHDLRELVAYRIEKDRVAGYLSVPKVSNAATVAVAN